MKYRWSYYNIDEKFDNFHIIFNTKTSAVIKIINNIYDQIQESFSHNYVDKNEDNLSLLLKQGFVIPLEINEFSNVKERYLKNFYNKNFYFRTL